MTYQAYIVNITAKTGKTPEELRDIAKDKGVLQPGVKAGAIIAWLKEDFDLGYGHSMAIVKWFKDHGEM